MRVCVFVTAGRISDPFVIPQILFGRSDRLYTGSPAAGRPGNAATGRRGQVVFRDTDNTSTVVTVVTVFAFLPSLAGRINRVSGSGGIVRIGNNRSRPDIPAVYPGRRAVLPAAAGKGRSACRLVILFYNACHAFSAGQTNRIAVRIGVVIIDYVRARPDILAVFPRGRRSLPSACRGCSVVRVAGIFYVYVQHANPLADKFNYS